MNKYRRSLLWLSILTLILKMTGLGFADSPKTAWKKTYTNGGEIVGLAVDIQDNIYLTGTTKSSSSYPDFLTVKYSPSGRLQWAARYGQAGRDDRPSSIKVDKSGNVYVTGSSDGGSSAYDFLTVKYNTKGSLQWARRLNNADNHSDFANDLAVDSAGNVFVTGGARFDASDYDIVTVKYGPSGQIIWIMRWSGPGILPSLKDDFGQYIATDATGNVYITGTSEFSSQDIVTIKADRSGQVLWASRYDGTSHQYDKPSGLAVDRAGNVTVAGNSDGLNSDQDMILLHYAGSGSYKWRKRYTSSGRYPDDVQDLFLDSLGNAYITGSTNVRGNNNFVTIKFAANGTKKWSAFYDDADYSDGAYSLDVDGAGNVYVTGDCQSQTLSNDIVTLKYDPQGKRAWLVRYSGPTEFDHARAVAVDSSGAVIVASDGLRGDWTIIKYIQGP
jgi:hypothetical protein